VSAADEAFEAIEADALYLWRKTQTEERTPETPISARAESALTPPPATRNPQSPTHTRTCRAASLLPWPVVLLFLAPVPLILSVAQLPTSFYEIRCPGTSDRCDHDTGKIDSITVFVIYFSISFTVTTAALGDHE